MTNSFHRKMLNQSNNLPHMRTALSCHLFPYHNKPWYLLTWTSLSSLSSRILSAVSASNISVAWVAVSCSSAKSAVTSANCKIINIEVNLNLPLHQLANCKKLIKKYYQNWFFFHPWNWHNIRNKYCDCYSFSGQVYNPWNTIQV